MRALLLTFLLTLSTGSGAEPTPAPTKAQLPPSKSKLNYRLGFGGQSMSVFRGAMLSEGGMIAPSMTMQYGPITFAGLAFVYSLQWDVLNLSFGANYFNDHMMIKDESIRRQRPETYEAWTKLTLPYSKQGAVFAGVNSDLRANWGQYISLGTSYTIANHYTLGVAAGGGPVSTNRYVYGPRAAAGLGHVDPSFTYTKMFLPWKGTLVASLVRPVITQTQNRNAGYVEEDDSPLVLSLSGIWNL